MQKIGLLAGVGRLPVEFARAARGMGFAVTAIAVVPGTDSELPSVADQLYTISAGELDKIITTLQQEGISEVTMIGKVTKELLFAGAVALDDRMKKLLFDIENFYSFIGFKKVSKIINRFRHL